MVQVPHFVKNCLKIVLSTMTNWHFNHCCVCKNTKCCLFLSGRYRESLIFSVPHILAFEWGAHSTLPVTSKIFPVTSPLLSHLFIEWTQRTKPLSWDLQPPLSPHTPMPFALWLPLSAASETPASQVISDRLPPSSADLRTRCSDCLWQQRAHVRGRTWD